MTKHRFRVIRTPRVSEFPLLLLPLLGIASGVALADWQFGRLMEIGPAPLVIGTAAILLITGILARAVRHTLTWAVLVFSVFMTIGGLRLLLDRKDYSCDWPVQAPLTLRAEVLSIEKQKAKTQVATIRIANGKYAGRKLRATLMRKSDSTEICPGDILLLHGEVEAPKNSGNPGTFDYARWLRRRDITGTMFCFANQWQDVGTSPTPSLSTRLLRLRQQWAKRYASHFSGEPLEVLSALTLGDRSLLTTQTRAIFSDSGSSHILALSGLHLGILFGTLLSLLQMLPSARHLRWLPLLLLPFVWTFVAFTGASFSLVRSAIMFSFVLISRATSRNASSFDGLLLAAVVILLAWPQALFDVGFLLSFLSVGGILLVTPYIPRLLPARPHAKKVKGSRLQRHLFATANFLVSLACVSLAAQVATAPLVAGTFHVLPVYGLLTSLFVIPLAYLLMLGALAFVFFPQIALILNILLQALHGILVFISSLPCATLHCTPSPAVVVLAYMVLALLWMALTRRRRRNLYHASIGVIVLAVTIACDHLQQRVRPQIIFYQTFGAPALHCIRSSSESYLWTSRPESADSTLAFIAGNFWRDRSIAPPVKVLADTTLPGLHLRSHILAFRGRRIGLLRENLSTFPPEPLPVTHLFVVKGYTRSLSEALRGFRPDTLVLDGSLSTYTRRRLLHEADNLHLTYHDIRRDGALIVQ